MAAAVLAAACGGGAGDAGGRAGATGAVASRRRRGPRRPRRRRRGADPARPAACAPDNAGLTLPAGFCATVFVDSVGGARHVAVAANGDVFVALSTPGRLKAGDETGQGARAGVVALRDTNGDGRADQASGSAAPAARASPSGPAGCTSTRGRGWCAIPSRSAA
jgi:hypothetical protein